jgi:hypothetical protein
MREQGLDFLGIHTFFDDICPVEPGILVTLLVPFSIEGQFAPS